MTQAQKLAAQARGASGPSAAPAFTPPPLTRGVSKWRKVALTGHVGTGKTAALVDLLLAGERLFILCTDQGLVTVENRLRDAGHPELIDNIMHVEARDYKTVNAILLTLEESYGNALRAFKPTVRVWEGFSVFQQVSVDFEIMPDKLRPKKVTASDGSEADDSMDPRSYWDKVRRATMRVHDRFLAMTYEGNPGWHTILTCHEDEDKDQKGNPLGRFHMAIQGGGRRSVAGEYDLILRTLKRETVGAGGRKFTYHYEVESAKFPDLKQRGFGLEGEMPADFGKVWAVVTGAAQPASV